MGSIIEKNQRSIISCYCTFKEKSRHWGNRYSLSAEHRNFHHCRYIYHLSWQYNMWCILPVCQCSQAIHKNGSGTTVQYISTGCGTFVEASGNHVPDCWLWICMHITRYQRDWRYYVLIPWGQCRNLYYNGQFVFFVVCELWYACACVVLYTDSSLCTGFIPSIRSNAPCACFFILRI